MSKIFISYSRKDSAFVDKTVYEMQRRNFRVWLDRADISKGANWQEKIREAISLCSAVVVFLSPDSVNSNNVLDEIKQAVDTNTPIIPYMLRQCTLPRLIDEAKLNYVDGKQEDAIDQLMEALPLSARIYQGGLNGEKLARLQGKTFKEASEGLENVQTFTVPLREDVFINLIGLPLEPTQYCTSYLVGREDDHVSWQPVAQLALQLFQQYPNRGFVNGIAKHFFEGQGRDYRLRLLLIQGPVRISYNSRENNNNLGFGLDNQHPTEWQDVIQAANNALNIYEGEIGRPEELHIFALSPAVLLYGLGVSLPHRGFYRTKLYQFDTDVNKYFQVLG